MEFLSGDKNGQDYPGGGSDVAWGLRDRTLFGDQGFERVQPATNQTETQAVPHAIQHQNGSAEYQTWAEAAKEMMAREPLWVRALELGGLLLALACLIFLAVHK